MSCCKLASDRNIAKSIIQAVEKHKCLYDRKDNDYREESVKKEAWESVFMEVNNELKQAKVLDEYLDFLIEHLDLDVEEENNEIPSVKPSKTGNTANDGRIQNIHAESSENENNTAQKPVQEPDTSETTPPPSHRNVGAQKQVQKPDLPVVTPPPSDNYEKAKQSISELERETMEVAAQAVKMMESMSDSCNSDTKGDVYLQAIKQALSEVPSTSFLECINGVLAIIDTFLT
ncbi:hypothetical protein QAD02_021615 [Eretmocerus hayati]|uniref:Uncharacterized protein n=1 Tax=Eretmocerus hayati TaxID=131215 RepID=A0ACC2PQX8_9HYME|nr:hypothetical protein QAD02_021615 [Eretmocerus hayati]